MRPDEDVFLKPIVPVIYETVEAGESQLRQEATTPQKTSQTPEDPLSPGMEPSFSLQVANPPTPVHERQADPPTPIMEMSKDPTTPVLRRPSTPLVTPVLHPTDEEDMQDQDTQGTQDQSQEF